jgi:hypothetical protein
LKYYPIKRDKSNDYGIGFLSCIHSKKEGNPFKGIPSGKARKPD